MQRCCNALFVVAQVVPGIGVRTRGPAYRRVSEGRDDGLGGVGNQ
jgi:hypothetical protein